MTAGRFAVRSAQPELMDGEHVSQADFAACLACLSSVNTLTRARPPTLRWIGEAARRRRPDAPLTVVDVGFGEGDMLRAIGAWAARQGVPVRLRGYDLNPRSVAVAQARTDPALGVEFLTGDALADGRPVDVVISSLTAHHMSDPQIVRFIAWMERVTTVGWFINDLHRHALAFHGFRLLAAAARWHPFVRHDGPVSIARSFRRADWLRLTAAAGLSPDQVDIDWRLPFRLCVSRVK